MGMFRDLHTALAETFSVRRSYFFLILGSAVFGALYVYIPIFITPGNDFAFFIQITPWWTLMLISVLAALMGLLAAMQAYVWKKSKAFKVNEAGTGFAAAIGSFVSGLFSSATCAACVSAVFSVFLPSAGIIFLL